MAGQSELRFGRFGRNASLLVTTASLAMIATACGGSSGKGNNNDGNNGNNGNGNCENSALQVSPDASAMLAEETDDLDPMTAGVQVNFTVAASDDFADGSIVTLAIDGDATTEVTAALSNGTATFAAFTLQPGANAIVAKANNTCDTEILANVNVTVTPAGPKCEISLPGETLTEDADNDLTNGVQAVVRVTTRGVEAGRTATLTVGTQELTTLVALNEIVFEGPDNLIELAEGMNDLTVRTSTEGGVDVECTKAVTVDTGRCTATITPGDGTMFMRPDDLDPDEAGFQQVLTLDTDCNDEAVAIFLANGTELGRTGVTRGRARTTVNLPAGDAVLIEATVAEPDGRDGRAIPVTYAVPPATLLVISEPAEGAFFDTTSDPDLETPGVPIDVTVAVSEGTVEAAALRLELDGGDDRGGTTFTNPTDNGDGTFTFSAVPLIGGSADNPAPHTLQAVGTDAADVTTRSVVVNVTVNDVPPPKIINLTSPTEGQVLNAEADLDPDTEAGLQFDILVTTENVATDEALTLVIDGAEAGNFNVGENGAGSISVTLPEGTPTIQVRINGTEVASAEVSVTVDTVIPTCEITAPQDGIFLQAATIVSTVAVTDAEEGAMVTLSVNDGGEIQAPNESGVALFDNVQLAEGENTLECEVTDAAGNESPEDTVVFNVDTLAPEVVFRSPGNGALFGEAHDLDGNLDNGFQTNIRIAVPNEPLGSEVALSVDDRAPVMAVTEGVQKEALFENVSLPEKDDIQLFATVTDQAGNSSNTSIFVSVRTPRLSVLFTAPTDGQFLNAEADIDDATGGVQINVEGTTDAGEGNSCTVVLNQGTAAEQQQDVTVTAEGTFVTATPFTIVEGANTVDASCTDELGNGGTALQSSFELDIEPPVCSFSTPTANQVFNAESPDADLATAGFQFVPVVTCEGIAAGQPATLVGADSDGDPISQIEATFNADGVATFPAITVDDVISVDLTAEAIDRANNSSGDINVSFSVDREVPIVTRVAPADLVVGQLEDTDRDTAGAQLGRMQFAVQGGTQGGTVTVAVTFDGSTTEFSGTIGANGVANIEGVVLFEGSNEMTVSHTDAAGNTGTLTETYEVGLTTPGLVVLDKNSQELTAEGTVVFNRNFDTAPGESGFQTDFRVLTENLSDEQEVRICSSLGGGAGTPDLGNCTSTGFENFNVIGFTDAEVPAGSTFGIASMPLLPMDQGEHQFVAEATSRFGNQATSQTFTIRVDSIRPTISTIAADCNNAGNDADPNVLFGVGEDQDGDAAGLQCDFSVTTSGVEDGRTVTLFTNNPVADTVLGTATVTGNAASFTVAGDNLVTLIEGPHRIDASVSDSAENFNDRADAGNPALNVIVDITAPECSFNAPAAGDYNATSEALTIDGANVSTNVQVSCTDSQGLNGRDVTLTNDNAGGEATRTIARGASSLVDFSGYGVGQGSNTLTVQTSDAVGNLSAPVTRDLSIDTIVPAVTITAPDAFTEGTAALLVCDEFTCDDVAADISDGFMDTNAITVDFDNVDGTTQVVVESRARTASQFALVRNGSFQVDDQTASLDAYNINSVGLRQGQRVLHITVTDDAGNSSTSELLYLDVRLGVPAVGIELVGGDGTPDTGDELADSHRFLVGDNNTPDTGEYRVSLVIVSDTFDGTDATLTINGSDVGTTPLSGGVATFNDVLLSQTPGVNTITATVDTGVYEIGDVLADDTPPSLSFTSPAPGGGPAADMIYTSSDDTDGEGSNGMTFDAGNAITMATPGVEDGQVVTLAVTEGGQAVSATGTTTTVTGEVATFASLVLPQQTGSGVYEITASVSDLAGNAAPAPTSLFVQVDVQAPSVVVPVACLGETTDDQVAAQTEPAECAAVCASDTCNRRGGSALLRWAAPGDDSDTGTVSAYDVRWAVSPDGSCTNFDFDSASSANISVTTPLSAPGEVQTAQVTGLTIETTYCFGVKGVDEVGNNGLLDGSVVTRTLAYELITVGTGTNKLGESLAFGADFNGDGCDDVVAGEWRSDGNRGAAEVFYGACGDQPADLRITGSTTNARFAQAMQVGDFNGDGFDDIAISGVLARNFDGAIFVYFGSASGLVFTANDGSQTTFPSHIPDLVIEPPAGSFHFIQTASRDRVNLNGDARQDNQNELDDIVVLTQSATRSAYVFYGASDLASQGTLTTTVNADVTIAYGTVPAGGNLFFNSGAGGDIDGDGVDDLLLGWRDTGNDVGELYLMYGGGSLPASLTMRDDLVSVTGDGSESPFFASSMAVDDFNGDGAGDLIVGDASAGFAYVYNGVLSTQGAPTFASRISGQGSSWSSVVRPAGDVSGDGLPDVLVSTLGEAVVVYGEGDGVDDASSLRYAVDGFTNFGVNLYGRGDYDNDGAMDIVVVDTNGTGTIFVLR